MIYDLLLYRESEASLMGTRLILFFRLYDGGREK